MATTLPHQPRTEDLLIGVLAVLALRRRETLKVRDQDFHSAFGSALEVFRAAGGDLEELADSYFADVVSKRYEELDDALIKAERFHLLRFPNPSYSRLQITMTPRVAKQLLARYEDKRDTFEKAATMLLERMQG